jgi:hypothetical protein
MALQEQGRHAIRLRSDQSEIVPISPFDLRQSAQRELGFKMPDYLIHLSPSSSDEILKIPKLFSKPPNLLSGFSVSYLELVRIFL